MDALKRMDNQASEVSVDEVRLDELKAGNDSKTFLYLHLQGSTVKKN